MKRSIEDEGSISARDIGFVVVVDNPRAGRARDAVVPLLASALIEDGHEVRLIEERTVEDARRGVRRAMGAGARALVVVGGDGMVHLGLQAVAETQVPLGVVPVGSGNDFARALGLPRRADRAVERIRMSLARGRERSVDLLRVGIVDPVGAKTMRWVAGSVSLGIDAEVNGRANRLTGLPGTLRYLVGAVQAIAAHRPWQFDASFFGVSDAPPPYGGVDDGSGTRLRWSSRGALLTIANSPTLGGGIPVSPAASIDDGMLDVVAAGDVGRGGAALLFPAMLLGGLHVHSSRVRTFRARRVDIAPATRVTAYGDGEPLGSGDISVLLVPGALRVLA